MSEFTYIGKSVPRIDGLVKTTGEAVFSADVKLPGMLYGRCLRSPHPFARILNVDISQAEKLSGVRAVISARNVKQSNCGEFLGDQFPLCANYAHYAGDEVAAVAAIDEDIAEEALSLIKVEYEILTPVLDPEAALLPGAPSVHPELQNVKNNVAHQVEFQRGDVEGAFSQADLVFEERFTTPTVHQGYLQPRDCIATWEGDWLTVRGAMQGPFEWRKSVANGVCIPESHVRMIPTFVGGGFGDNASRIWPIAGLLSRAAGKPVRLGYSREEDFVAGRPFPASVVKIKMGFTRDGKLLAQSKDLILDGGAYTGIAFALTVVAAGRVDNMYRFANARTLARLVYTNTTPKGALRGFGAQVMTFAIESMMEIAAAKLGISPVEIRLKNASQQGDRSVHGFYFRSCGLSETIKQAEKISGFNEKREAKKKDHGIGMATTIHVAGTRTIIPVYDGSAAMVLIDDTGVARVISGETDIGQGSSTIFAMIAAEELGIAVKDVVVMPVDTGLSPFSKGTFASRVTALGGNAVKVAAKDARRLLMELSAAQLNIPLEELELRESRFYRKGTKEPVATLAEVTRPVVIKRCGLPVIGLGSYTVPDYVTKAGKDENYYGSYSVAYTFVTEVAEVSVDRETGKVTVHDIWTVADVGRVLNPKMCEAQVEGGVLMGMAYGLKEQYIWNNGKLLNPGFQDYKMPMFADVPRLHSAFVETVDPETPYGAKSVGEAVTTPASPAIANAIYNAVGIRMKDLPITPDKVLKALKEQKS